MNADDMYKLFGTNVAIVLGLQAAVLTLFSIFINRSRRRLVDEIEKHRCICNKAECEIRALAELQCRLVAAIQYHGGILQRLAQVTHAERHLPKLREELMTSGHQLRKPLQELLLFSDGKWCRRSAYQYLSQQLGDSGTLELMRIAARLKPDVELEGAIDFLEKRLNTTRIPTADGGIADGSIL